MSLSFYKANKMAKGSALSVNFSAKADREGEKGDKSFYINLIAQTAWNQETRTGSFKDGKKLTVKLSPNEIAGMIAAVSKNTSLAEMMNAEYVYHDGKDYGTTITFAPAFKKVKEGDKWVDTDRQVGYSFKLSKVSKANKDQKEYLSIGLTYAEVELLVRFLVDGLGHIFNALYSDDVNRGKARVTKTVQKTKEVAEEPSVPEDDGGGDW